MANETPSVNGSDPAIQRQVDRQTSSLLSSSLSRSIAPIVNGAETVYPQSTATTTANSVTITSSVNNDTGDITTVYNSGSKITVNPINQTVNQYTAVDSGVTAIVAGNGITIASTGGNGKGVVTINNSLADGNVGNIISVNLDGNVANVLHGDGSWSADVTDYSNSNVISLLSAFGSNVITTTGLITGDGGGLSNIAGGSNTQIQINNEGALSGSANLFWDSTFETLYTPKISIANAINSTATQIGITPGALANGQGPTWTFDSGGGLYWPASGGAIWVIEPNTDGEFEFKSTSNIVISTDISNANSHFTFDTDGIFTAPSNVNLLGSRLNVGPDAATAANLLNPTLVIANTGAQYIQAAIINNDGTGSSDWSADGAGGGDDEAWTDMGFAGHSFSDANYTITNPGDGYLFVQAYANGLGGNMVLATGENGNSADIVFATGGFLSNNEFARINHAANSLVFARPNSSIQFADGSAITDNLEGTGDFGVVTPANVGFMIETDGANAYSWTFGKDGLITLPGGYTKIGAQYGSEAILSSNVSFGVATQGNATTFINWSDDVSNTSMLAAIYVNDPTGNAGNISVRTGNVGNANVWKFVTDGSVIFPTLTVDIHNGGNQQAQTLQFGDPTQQAIITGPTPAPDTAAQRLIIQGQRGNGLGEGGDVYLWAGDAEFNGGDIKIYAGDADDLTAGSGGYINLDGGSGFNGGGQINITGGYSSNGQGGATSLSGGQGGADGGAVSITGGGGSTAQGGNIALQGGYGGNTGGEVRLTGGSAGTGIPGYGNVVLVSGASTWTFDNNGNLVLAGGNSVIQSIANSSLDPLNPNVSTMTLTPDANYNSQILVLDPTAPGHIHLRAYCFSNIDEPAANIFLGGENTAFEITQGANNVAKIHSGGNTWTFGNDGNLTTGNIIFDTAGRHYIYYGANNYINMYNDGGMDLSCNTEVKITTNYGDAPNRAYSYFYANGAFSTGDIIANGNISAPKVQANTAFQLPVYASNTARDTAIAAPATGMMVFVTGSGMQVYGASAWNAVAGTST